MLEVLQESNRCIDLGKGESVVGDARTVSTYSESASVFGQLSDSRGGE
jgi:hypothetical protein